MELFLDFVNDYLYTRQDSFSTKHVLLDCTSLEETIPYLVRGISILEQAIYYLYVNIKLELVRILLIRIYSA